MMINSNTKFAGVLAADSQISGQPKLAVRSMERCLDVQGVSGYPLFWLR